jgi:D-alanyl-D-alanine dipeptidase
LSVCSCHGDYKAQEQTILDLHDEVLDLNDELNKQVAHALDLDSLIQIQAMDYYKKNTILNTKRLDSFVRLSDLSKDFSFDLRYASSDNFLKEAVYDCGACYVRLKTAYALLKANEQFKTLGYRIKFFDCYRPLSVQQKMWASYPNPNYLSNPKKGSIHNKGAAVDITLIDKNNKELDMGTRFDHFGKEAHYAYENLSATVIANRKLLRNTMLTNGFWSIRTEWWHFNLKGGSRFSVANFEWPCD